MTDRPQPRAVVPDGVDRARHGRRRLRHPVGARGDRPGQRRRGAGLGGLRVPARRAGPVAARRARRPRRPARARLGVAGARGLRSGAQDRGAGGPRRRRRRPRARSSASPPTSPPARWCPRPPTAPRCARSPEHVADPHAYVKLWKHHAAQPQADRINELARKRDEAWLPRYGGLISSEWEFAKGLELLEEAPGIYAEMAHFVEAADWIVWQLSGSYFRNACTAGYKGIYQDGTYPTPAFLGELNPDFATFVEDKLDAPDRPARRRRRATDQAGRRVDRTARGHHRGRRQRRRPRHRAGRRRDRRRPDGRDHGHLDLPRDEQRHPA